MITAERTGSQFLNCSNFTTDQLLSANLAKGLSGAVCCFITLVLLFILVFVLRAYKGLLQRLILYYAVVTFFYHMLTASLLEHQTDYQENGQNTVCAVLGFSLYYAANVIVILAAIIINYLMYLVLRSSKCSSFTTTKRNQLTVESVCVGIPFVLPLTYLWPPLTDGRYGISGAYCGIKTTDENCKPIIRDVIINYTITELTVLEMFVVVIITLIAYCRIRLHLPPGKKMNVLVQKTLFLLILYAAMFIVNTILLVVVTLKQTYFLILADALWFPFFFEFTFIVLFIVSARISERCLTQRRVDINENNHRVRSNSESVVFKTNPASHPFRQPSKTYFSIPYTGGFTDVKSLESNDQNTEGENSLMKQLSWVKVDTVD